MSGERTSIGFGGGRAVEVGLPLDEVRELVQKALSKNALVELEPPGGGEPLIFNPWQVKLIQPAAGDQAEPQGVARNQNQPVQAPRRETG